MSLSPERGHGFVKASTKCTPGSRKRVLTRMPRLISAYLLSLEPSSSATGKLKHFGSSDGMTGEELTLVDSQHHLSDAWLRFQMVPALGLCV